jgi:hypothetical protein
LKKEQNYTSTPSLGIHGRLQMKFCILLCLYLKREQELEKMVAAVINIVGGVTTEAAKHITHSTVKSPFVDTATNSKRLRLCT